MKVGKNEKGGTLQKIKNERPGTFLGVIESLRSFLSRCGAIKKLWFEKNGLEPQTIPSTPAASYRACEQHGEAAE
jgi:hypothetical protein